MKRVAVMSNSWVLILAIGFLLTSGLFAEDDWLPGQWTGTWDENSGAAGTLKITIEKRPDGTLGGKIYVEMNGTQLYTTDFKEVTQRGNKVTIKYDHPSAPIQVVIGGDRLPG